MFVGEKSQPVGGENAVIGRRIWVRQNSRPVSGSLSREGSGRDTYVADSRIKIHLWLAVAKRRCHRVVARTSRNVIEVGGMYVIYTQDSRGAMCV